jgi:hypothetical protein
MHVQGLETHLWVGNHSREIEIQGQPMVLYCCPVCGRDFAREPGASTWKAAVIGTFKVEYLPDSVSEDWVLQPCPGLHPPFASENVVETERISSAGFGTNPAEPNGKVASSVLRNMDSSSDL